MAGFIDNSDKVLAAMHKQLLKGLESCGLVAEGYAIDEITRQKAVDTGRLRASITHKVVKEEQACYIGTNVKYAPYVEFGTGIYATNGGGRRTPWVYAVGKGENKKFYMTNGMKARPFLKPAASNHRKEYLQILADALSE